MALSRRVAIAAAAATADGTENNPVDIATTSSQAPGTGTPKRKGPYVSSQQYHSPGKMPTAVETATASAAARGTRIESVDIPQTRSVSFRAGIQMVRCGSLARTRHTLSSRQSLYKSFRNATPWAGSRVAVGRFSEGGTPVTTGCVGGQCTTAHDASGGSGKNTLMFQPRLVLRHEEYWTGKLSTRRDAEVAPEILCAQYHALQQTLFIGLSTGVLLVWRSPFSAVPGQPDTASVVMKAKEHTGALCALAFQEKLEVDPTPHHFQALQHLQGAQCFQPSQNRETLSSWTMAKAKQQQQQEASDAIPADHRISAAAARHAATFLQRAEAAVMPNEERTGVLFTGSADRRVKVWFIHEKKVECIKTLCFHGGTIVALTYCSPFLFSSSTDGTVLICRVERTLSALKHPQFTPVQRIFTHQSYHPSTKLILSNKTVWYDALAATRKDGDTIYLYCGATDGSVLALDNSSVLVPSNPVIGGGGAPPLSLKTQERAANTAASQRKAHASFTGNNNNNSDNTYGAAGCHSASAVCDPAKWKDLLGCSNNHSDGNNDSNDGETQLLTDQIKASCISAAGALTPSLEGLSGGAVLPVPFRILKKLHVHSLGIRQLLCLPLESVVSSLGSEASVAVMDPLTAQVWWRNENPEGCCYSASTWMPAYNLLLVGDDGGNLSFYNVYSRERVYSQQVTTNQIVSLGPGRCSTQVLACTPHEFIVIDIVEAANEVQLEGHIAFYKLQTGRTPAVQVRWDPLRGLCCRVVRHKHADITSWLFVESLGGFVTGHEDGDVRFWTSKEFLSFSIRSAKGQRLHTNSVASMCCWPIPESRRGGEIMSRQSRQGGLCESNEKDGLAGKTPEDGFREAFLILSCGYDGRLNLFELRIDTDTGEVSAKLIEQVTREAGNAEEILCCVEFHGQDAFFTGSADRSVRVWTVDPAQCIHEISNQGEPAACLISFESSSEAYWGSMTWTGDISLWDSRWRLVASRRFQTGVNCFVFSESLKYLFVGTDSGEILTTPLPPRQALTVIEKGRVTVGGVSFHETEEEKPT